MAGKSLAVCGSKKVNTEPRGENAFELGLILACHEKVNLIVLAVLFSEAS